MGAALSVLDKIAGALGFVRESALPKADLRRPPNWSRFLDEVRSRRHHPAGELKSFADVFKAAEPPPGVLPKGEKLAFDDASALGVGAQWAGSWSSGYAEGLYFMGYPVLAEMAQRPEYRRAAEILATEMTRKGWELQVSGEEDAEGSDEDLEEKIVAVEAELVRIGTKAAFCKAAAFDAYFGRSHIYIDTGATDDSDELKTPIWGKTSLAKFKGKKDAIKGLRCVEATWTYPKDYDTSNPLKPTWYKPTSWWVMAEEVHASRLLTFVGREVPELLKPAYSFGGLALTQMMKPYVDNWLNVRQGVTNLVLAFTKWVLKTDMQSVASQPSTFFDRLELLALCSDNLGVLAIQGGDNGESLDNIAAPLGGLHELQAQAQEHMCSVTGEPVVKLLGIQPGGLNATSEGELRAFEEWIGAYQESFFRPNLEQIVDLVQVCLFGEVDKRIRVAFVPLRTMTEKELAEIDEIESRADAARIESGVISQEEARGALARKAGSRYSSIKPDDLPEPSPEEMEELGKAAAGFGRGEKGEAEAGEGGEGEVEELDREAA